MAIIKPVGRLRPCMTGGIQKCTGASPTLRARAIVISVVATGCVRY